MGQKLGIVSFTEHGSQLNERLREMLERSGYVCESYAAEKYAGKYHLFPLKVSAKAWTEKMFQSMDALLFIGACGHCGAEHSTLSSGKRQRSGRCCSR